MGKNRGKQFEAEVKKAFQKCTKPHYLLRLYDPGFGFSGVKNFADFVLFISPYMVFIECKSTDGGTFNFNQLSENQFNGLLDAACKEATNILAGVLIWFKERDITVFVPINAIYTLKREGKKSIAVNELNQILHIEFEGQKRRQLFSYDADKFVEKIIKFKEIGNR